MVKVVAAVVQDSKTLFYRAAYLQLRQITRQVCRKQFDQDKEEALDPAQQEMFPGLQSRYPTAHSKGEEPSYVLRQAMTSEDVIFNVNRLRRDGQTKPARGNAI